MKINFPFWSREKMFFLIEYILCIIVIFFSAVLIILPLRVGLLMGRFFGGLIYYLNIRRRRVAYANMKSAFKGSRTPEEMDRLIKNMYKNFGEVFVEVLVLPKVSARYLRKNINIQNLERIGEALKNKNGVIFLTAHFGNWELVSLVSALVGYPLLVLAREQKMKKLNGLLNFYRGIKGCKVIKKGSMPQGAWRYRIRW